MTPFERREAQALSPDGGSARIKTAIRRLMKARGHTYQDLADHLAVSLATAKRIVSTDDLSLTRLLEIAAFFDLSLGELEAYALEEGEGEPQYTEEQELFLASEPRYFHYFVSLFEMTPEQIAARYGLTRKSTDHYLLKLERAGLVRVTGAGKVKPTYRQAPRWRRGGPLIHANYERMMTAYHTLFMKLGREQLARGDTKDGPAAVTMRARSVTRHTYDELRQELERLQQRIVAVSGLETKTEPKERLGRLVMIVGDAWLKEGDPDLETFDEVFGAITNV